MSLAPKEIKSKKRINQVKEGTNLFLIHDMYYLQDANKVHIKPKGFSIMCVLFRLDIGDAMHEERYTIDNAIGSNNFKKMLSAAQVVPSEGNTPRKKDCVGKRLWLSIKAVHHIQDDKPILDEEGKPFIEYFCFKVTLFADGHKRPNIQGDPELNAGVSSGLFVDWKNFSVAPEPVKPEPLTVVKKEAPTNLPDQEPVF